MTTIFFLVIFMGKEILFTSKAISIIFAERFES
jgi:hypothetical protein